jgi:hypothetical protein
MFSEGTLESQDTDSHQLPAPCGQKLVGIHGFHIQPGHGLPQPL